MARMLFKNTFGSQNSRLDLQRQDLFKFTINLPPALGLDWTENVEFAVEKFPFPERSIEVIGVKYMQQTNFLIGGDTPTPAVEIPIRYAFGQLTAQALEKWMWLTRNLREVIVDLYIVPTDAVEKIYINATVLELGALVNAVTG